MSNANTKNAAATEGCVAAVIGYAVPLRKIRRGGKCYVPEHKMLEVYRRSGGFVDRYYDGVRNTIQLTMETMVIPASADSLICPHNDQHQATASPMDRASAPEAPNILHFVAA